MDNPGSFLDVVKQRRSVRAYLPDAVPEEKLKAVLEAARWAPSACNRQPWRIIVVQSEESRRALSTAYSKEWFWTAPIVLAVCVWPKEAYVRGYDGKNFADVDGSILMDHITLAAASVGLGTCWIGAFEPESAKQILRVPDGVEVLAMTPLGTPDVEANPRLRERRPLSETVMRDAWS